MSAAGLAAGFRQGTGGYGTAGRAGGTRSGSGIAGFLRRALGLTGKRRTDGGASVERAAKHMAPHAQEDARRALAREQGCSANNLFSQYVPGQYVRMM